MSSGRLPTLKARDLISALQHAGFSIVRSSGSHYRLVADFDANRQVTVPVHGGKDLSRKLVHAILRQAGLTMEELQDLL